jgi:hypothetical protein
LRNIEIKKKYIFLFNKVENFSRSVNENTDNKAHNNHNGTRFSKIFFIFLEKDSKNSGLNENNITTKPKIQKRGMLIIRNEKSTMPLNEFFV